LAQNTQGISLIVGGHSHSLLLKNSSVWGWEGLYPTQVQNLNGKNVTIVQAHRFGDYGIL
jgi:2',3'-cyclic-nucleotide 2'-phosphodiesterase (5'-nucleotidase family)